jgi:AAA family ATP:ADP antiporter
LLKSLKCIYKSKYIRYIATLVICYGISINLVEVVWKGQVGLLYITKASYSSFMGSLQIITGIVTILCMIIGSNIIRKTSWFTAAIITPIVILITGLFFFVFIMFKDHIIKTILNSELATLNIIIFVGFVQNCTTKGMKYSLFDSTKEMSYIPLDDDLKSSGKAVADGIGLSIGKSGGSLILYILLNVIFIGSTLIQLVPMIAIIFIAIVVLWISSVIKLNKKFKKLYSNNI